MNIILFLIVLGVLIFIHELGHFLFAKLFKIRVDEFGFGFPPRAKKLFRWKGTDFTLNWIPFGGFVKIFGESHDGSELSNEEKKVSLIYKPRWQQFLVMFGGILFNLLFAWILFSGMYVSGVTAPTQSAPQGYSFDETKLLVSGVSENGPAHLAGLIPGDEIKEYFSGDIQIPVTTETVIDVSNFINEQRAVDENIGFVVMRKDQLNVIEIEPEFDSNENLYKIGVSLDRVGIMQLPLHTALWYGAKNTWLFTEQIVLGFIQLITGKVSFDNVSGPVGIVKQVGDASSIGFAYLIGFTALLSINLAVLNFIPFPALDGGRILIIAIESLIQKRLKPLWVNWLNIGGFFALILLMIVITVKDVINLF